MAVAGASGGHIETYAEAALREGLPWLRKLEGWEPRPGDPYRRPELEGLPPEGPGLVLFGALTDQEVRARVALIAREAAPAATHLQQRKATGGGSRDDQMRDLAEDVICYCGWANGWPVAPGYAREGAIPEARQGWEFLLRHRGLAWVDAYLEAMRQRERPLRVAQRPPHGEEDEDEDEEGNAEERSAPGRTLIPGPEAERRLRAEAVDPWEIVTRALRRVLPAATPPPSYWDHTCHGPDGTESRYVPFLLRFRRRVGEKLRQALRPSTEGPAVGANGLGGDLVEALALLSAGPLAKALGNADDAAVAKDLEQRARALDCLAWGRVRKDDYRAELEAVARGDPPANYDLRRHAKDALRDARLRAYRNLNLKGLATPPSVKAALGGRWGRHAARLLAACDPAAARTWTQIVAKVTRARPVRGQRSPLPGSWRADPLMESAALLVAAAVAEALGPAGTPIR